MIDPDTERRVADAVAVAYVVALSRWAALFGGLALWPFTGAESAVAGVALFWLIRPPPPDPELDRATGRDR